MKKFRNGQSTLEYVIILAAVVGAIIAVAGALKGKLGNAGGVYDTVSKKMQTKISDVSF